MSNQEAYLRNSLVKYKHPELAKREVLNVFQQFNDLRAKLEPFIFNDGTKKDLLCLQGTIPVHYKGALYNIPLCCWLLDTHPYNPPMMFVKPTSTMQIRSGRNVDANGKIELPYLREWRHPNSDLLGLMQILTIVFGEEPPVFSRVPARPAYPPGGTSQPSSGTPPYPTGQPYMPMPSVGNQSSGYQPPAAGYQPMNYPQPTTGYPNYQGGYQPPGYPTTSASTGTTSSYPNPNQSFQGYQGYPSNPPQYPGQGYTPPTSSANTESRPMTGTVSEEHLKASMLSAVEDKMKRRLKEIFEQAQFEMEALDQTQKDLQKGKEKLENMISSLEIEKNDINKNIHLLNEKDTEIKESLRKLESQDKLDIDEAVAPTAPLYKQLLNSFAEEQAIDDAIYYLGEALRKDVIELDVFLKQVRELSRRQFMLRALIQKCREKAGLPILS